jgi:hypothetical protein
LASQTLAEDETDVAVRFDVAGLRFAFLRSYLLGVVAGYEDGAAVLQMLFYDAEINLCGFMYRDVLVCVVV